MNTYTETQRLDQWWIKVIIAIPLFEIVAFILNDYQSTGDVDTKWLIRLVVFSLVVALVLIVTLTTEIDEKGIRCKVFPFHFKQRTYTWNNIETAYIREYAPLKEYGGWGIRYSIKNGKAFNIKGKIGLQLVLKNGDKILVGTSDKRRLENYLQDLNKQYTIAALD